MKKTKKSYGPAKKGAAARKQGSCTSKPSTPTLKKK